MGIVVVPLFIRDAGSRAAQNNSTGDAIREPQRGQQAVRNTIPTTSEEENSAVESSLYLVDGAVCACVRVYFLDLILILLGPSV